MIALHAALAVPLQPAFAADLKVGIHDELLGDWYAEDEVLRLTIAQGRPGSVTVRGVEDRAGRHCSWEAGLLDIGPARIDTTGAHIVRADSDPACTSGRVAYDYEVQGHGQGAVLLRTSIPGTTPLRFHRRP